RHDVIASNALGYPVTLRDTVAVEPEDKAGFNGRFGGFPGGGFRGISGTGRIEHRYQRRQADADGGSGERGAFQKSPSGYTGPLNDYVRPSPPSRAPTQLPPRIRG